MKTKWYRVRIRTKTNSFPNYVIADKIPDLQSAYEIVARSGVDKWQSRKFSIDEVTVNLHSVLTGKIAKQRLEELRYENHNAE
jgi:hypothetical protein